MPKRMYRERGQPNERSHFGILEKKQDWQKRATHYKEKKNKMTLLENKAKIKNDQEFYFKMQNSEQIKGEVRLKEKNKKQNYVSPLYKEMFEKDQVLNQNVWQEGPKKNPKDLNIIIKNKNQNVVKIQKQRLKKKIDKLKANLHFIDQGYEKQMDWDIIQDSNELTEVLKQKQNKSNVHENTLKNKEIYQDEEHMKEIVQQNKKQYKKLMDLIDKHNRIEKYLLKLDEEKAFKSEGAKRKIIKKGKVKLFRQRKN
jgi:U3 small nucleolar RNA-associated protein 11